MWASRSVSFTYVGYWSFQYGSLLVGLNQITISGYHGAWTFLNQMLAIRKIQQVDQMAVLQVGFGQVILLSVILH